MTSVVLTAQERLSAIQRYTPGGEAPRRAGKLSANESPLGPSPLARRAIAVVADEAHRYATSYVLQAQLASALGLDADQVVVTNGSDELCYLIATVFLTPGAP